jgi:N-acyl-L-homoserine lactone synthetase
VYLRTLQQDFNREQEYCVRHLTGDEKRSTDYQLLRAQIFVKGLNWNIPLDYQGREIDRYDQIQSSHIDSYGVYGIDTNAEEHFLGGIRIFHLRKWSDSMVMQEFRDAGMIPDTILHQLQQNYDHRTILELTRFCVQRGRRYLPSQLLRASGFAGFNLQIARDLTYASVYAVAKNTAKYFALGIADAGYLNVMRRSHFTFQTLYTHETAAYSLVLIDLFATIDSIRSYGESIIADRMLSLCTPPN